LGFRPVFSAFLLLIIDGLFELAADAVLWGLGGDGDGSLGAEVFFR
jgi:hypothetical protein